MQKQVRQCGEILQFFSMTGNICRIWIFCLDETFRAQGLGLEGEAEERLAAGRVLPLDPEAGTPMWEKLAVFFLITGKACIFFP